MGSFLRRGVRARDLKDGRRVGTACVRVSDVSHTIREAGTHGTSLRLLYLLRYRYRIQKKTRKPAMTKRIKSFVKSSRSVNEYPRILTTYLHRYQKPSY